jgi:hypothetical protein
MKNSICSVRSGWVLLVAVAAMSATACVGTAGSDETESSPDDDGNGNGRAAPQANRSSGIAQPDNNVKAGGPNPWPWQFRDNK